MTLDTATGYTFTPGSVDTSLTLVGKGTPMGELMRRYWQPVALSSTATHKPRMIRALGEDLVLFRDRSGKVGLLYPRCQHRGTSLYYGRTEDRGIRCCFHGWLFDVEGNCLEQPCEPEGGKFRDRIRQPWYPVEERYGLVFAYMGPPERKPVMPRYAVLENLEANETVRATNQGFVGRGPRIVPCNWLQVFETNMDQMHIPILHGTFSGTQFVPLMNNFADLDWQANDANVVVRAVRKLDDGRVYERVGEARVPNVRGVPDPFFGDFGLVTHVHWTLPIDDTHFTAFVAYRDSLDAPRSDGDDYFSGEVTPGGKHYDEMTEEEHRDFPDDYEAQVSEGPITLHSEEHLATSDRGIALWRRLLRKQLDAIAAGQDPVGVSFEETAPIEPAAGAFLEEAETSALSVAD